jgi:hypothetical protein
VSMKVLLALSKWGVVDEAGGLCGPQRPRAVVPRRPSGLPDSE